MGKEFNNQVIGLGKSGELHRRPRLVPLCWTTRTLKLIVPLSNLETSAHGLLYYSKALQHRETQTPPLPGNKEHCFVQTSGSALGSRFTILKNKVPTLTFTPVHPLSTSKRRTLEQEATGKRHSHSLAATDTHVTGSCGNVSTLVQV